MAERQHTQPKDVFTYIGKKMKKILIIPNDKKQVVRDFFARGYEGSSSGTYQEFVETIKSAADNDGKYYFIDRSGTSSTPVRNVVLVPEVIPESDQEKNFHAGSNPEAIYINSASMSPMPPMPPGPVNKYWTISKILSLSDDPASKIQGMIDEIFKATPTIGDWAEQNNIDRTTGEPTPLTGFVVNHMTREPSPGVMVIPNTYLDETPFHAAGPTTGTFELENMTSETSERPVFFYSPHESGTKKHYLRTSPNNEVTYLGATVTIDCHDEPVDRDKFTNIYPSPDEHGNMYGNNNITLIDFSEMVRMEEDGPHPTSPGNAIRAQELGDSHRSERSIESQSLEGGGKKTRRKKNRRKNTSKGKRKKTSKGKRKKTRRR